MKPTVRQADHRLARRKWRTTKPSEVARRALRREGSTGKPEPRGCRSTVCGARKTLGTKLDLSMFLQEPLGFSPREFQLPKKRRKAPRFSGGDTPHLRWVQV